MGNNSKEQNNDPEAMDNSDEEDEDYIPRADPNKQFAASDTVLWEKKQSGANGGSHHVTE